MTDISIGRIARRGVSGTFDPRGRDDRVQFWLYFVLAFAPLLLVQIVAQTALAFPSIDFGAMPKTDAERQTANLQTFRDMADAIVAMGYINVTIQLVAVLLVLAATARRLHDRGRSGWWSLVLPFTAAASGFDQARRMEAMVVEFPKIASAMTPDKLFDFPFRLQAAMPGPSWPAIIGGVAMLWLATELLRAGTPGENRFGPQP